MATVKKTKSGSNMKPKTEKRTRYKKSYQTITREDMESLFEEENIIQNCVSDILLENAKEFYNEVIFHRGIPDGRDGLTDVQRRIIFSCHDKGWDYHKAHVKSARVVGETMGRFHPRGDASIYQASVNMAQPWKNYICTIDWHGGKGTISGSSASAQRYTEQRISKETCNLVTDGLRDNSVDMRLNFSQDEEEPCTLPVKVPLLLINGSFGIAVGYISSIPNHNPREVIDETIKRLKDPTYEVELLPDLPTGGVIINTNQVRETYKDFNKAIAEKNCSMIMRAKIEKDEDKNTLTITQLPFMTTCESLVDSIKDATKETEDPITKKKLPPKINSIRNIKNLTSKTSENTVRILIELKNGFSCDLEMSKLFSYTKCQKTSPLSFISVIKDNFLLYDNITEIVDNFITYRKSTVKRIKSNLIKKYKLRIHIIEGLLSILNSSVVDKVLKDIRKCSSKAEVVSMLQEKYDLTNIQAEHIAEYKLYQLASMEIDKLKNELSDKKETVEIELSYFKDDEMLNQYIIDELAEIKDKYFPTKRFPRRTELLNISLDKEQEILATIPDEYYVLFFTKNGYVKKIEIPRTTKRNTRGISVGKMEEDDYVTSSMILHSKDKVLAITEKGHSYPFNVYEIPNSSSTSVKGTRIIDRTNNERIINLIPVKDEDFENEDLFLLTTSDNNLIKLTPFTECISLLTRKGIIVSKLKETGETDRNGNPVTHNLICAEKVNANEVNSIIALNNFGDAIRIPLDQIPCNQRTTYGSLLFWNKLTSLNGKVMSVSLVDKDSDKYFVISSNGMGKKMNISEFDLQNRAHKGKMACKLKEGTEAVKLLSVREDDKILVISNKKIIIVDSSNIKSIGRTTYGFSIKKLDEDEYIVDCAIKQKDIEVD